MSKHYNCFSPLLPQAYKIAENSLDEFKNLLTVGSYTAIEIDRIYRKSSKDYLKKRKKCAEGIRDKKREIGSSKKIKLYAGEYLPCDLVSIEAGDLSLTFPLFAVFYILWKLEVLAGIKSTKRHKFHIKPKGDLHRRNGRRNICYQ